MKCSRKSLDLANLILQTQKSKVILFVEIGVYNGVNAACVGSCLKNAGKQANYIGFDFFEDAIHKNLARSNPGVHKELKGSSQLQEDMKLTNIQTLLQPYYRHVTLLKGDSAITVPKNIGCITKAHVYFIDGAHTYTDVKRDYTNIVRVARSDSLIVLDDPHVPGIAKFVGELQKEGKKFGKIIGSVYTLGG